MGKVISQKIRNYWFALPLVFILILGNNLRSFSYSSVPIPGETADEYSFGWVGLSLLKDRYPVAWSGRLAYGKHDFQKINVDGIFTNQPDREAFSIDKPWFDHPPLFGLLTGGYSYLKGAREFKDTSVILLRRPMLKIGIITTILIFVLASKMFGVRVGLFSALLYSIIPTTIISSRLALAENGYTPLFLGSLIFAYLYIQSSKNVYWIGGVILAMIAMLFKFSAVSISISLILIALIYGGNNRKFLVSSSVLGIVGAFLIFALYGALYDWNIFWNVFTDNAGRFYGAGSEIFLQAVVQARITTTKFLTDGWIVVGWVAFFILSFSQWRKNKGGTIISIAVLSYLVVFILFGSESYGWYKFPYFPFLVISASWLVEKLYKDNNVLVFSGLMLFPFGSAVHRLLGIMEFQKYTPYFRVFSIFLLLVFALSMFAKKNGWAKVVIRVFMTLILVFVVWLSIREIFFYSIDKWYFVT